MGKLVLDTNALIRSIPRVSPYHELYLSLFDGRNILCVTNEMLEEYQEVLERHTNSIIARSVIEQILNNESLSDTRGILTIFVKTKNYGRDYKN